jgi:RNA polymerase sigma-70 factor (ECF subfamily)
MTNNFNDTEDLLQEIFYKVFMILKKFNPNKASFRTWIYRVSKNYVINHLKSANYRLHHGNYEYDDTINKSKEDIEENAINDNRIDMVLKAMSNVLSKKHFEIMHLHYFSNLTVKEISESLGIPNKTVYKAIKSSIEKIKKEVG